MEKIMNFCINFAISCLPLDVLRIAEEENENMEAEYAEPLPVLNFSDAAGK